jgi:hypothetical protein
MVRSGAGKRRQGRVVSSSGGGGGQRKAVLERWNEEDVVSLDSRVNRLLGPQTPNPTPPTSPQRVAILPGGGSEAHDVAHLMPEDGGVRLGGRGGLLDLVEATYDLAENIIVCVEEVIRCLGSSFFLSVASLPP